jgi:cell division protein FtsB
MRLIKNIIFIFLILFLFSSLLKNIFNHQNRLQFYQDYKNEFEKEEKRNIELKTEVVRKKSSEEIEKTIRNKLNLAKPNEVVVILPHPTSVPAIISPTPAPNWKQWLNLFFK